ncbi:MAG: BON domain-containing protein [Beijerinckiaceae bacterium]
MAREHEKTIRRGGEDTGPQTPERLVKEAGTGWEETPDGYGEDYGRDTKAWHRGYGPFGGGGDVGRSHGEYTGGAPTDGRDVHIREKIAAELEADADIDHAAVEVAVTEGAAVLTGVVGSHAMRERANARAKSVEGVECVRNDLKIAKQSR